MIEVSQIVVQETDQPDAVFDLPDPHELPREHSAEVNLALADADAAATRDAHGSVVERVLGLGRRLVDAG